MAKTWFITGASRGFGREWTCAALERGDQVAALVRDPSRIYDLVHLYGDQILPLNADVTHRDEVFDAVDRAYRRFGVLDVVINNAGFGVAGAIEELSEEDARAQIETNLFGTLWVTQAVLPLLRKQGGGHIIQLSSAAGILAQPGLGIYNASKWAVEGLSQALAKEVREFGIKVTIVEPSAFATESSQSMRRATPIRAYDGQRYVGKSSAERGDPFATRNVILQIADLDEPPLRVFFGDAAYDTVVREYHKRLDTWERWRAFALAAYRMPSDADQFPAAKMARDA